jgi:predicted phage tail protein
MNTNLIIGSGGGGKGGGSHTPVESPDTLKSQSFAEVVDLLCEGEIVGLVDGIKSIYINDTPIQNSDGTFNYEESGFQYYFRTGTQDQEYIPGFEVPQAEIPVGREVKFSSPVTETVVTSAEENVDFVRVTIDIPALVHYADNGDTNGSEVQFNIDIIKNGLGNSPISAVKRTVIGKTTSNYQLSYLIELPRTPGMANEFFAIKVTKLTKDSTTLKLQNTLKFSSFTKVSNTKMRYPNSALCAMRMASSQFNSIPKRGYHVKLLKVKIPSNYNPETREYTGIWDGTFDYAWTNNPAWCYYDLITNERYGLGEYISEDLVDKWSLYTIAQYCDQSVPTGFKTTEGTDILEPRFTLNTYIQERQEAIKLLYDIASAFRGMIYWTNGTLHTEQDSSSSTPTLQFTNSNVVGGTFTYSGASKKVVHTAALVTWNDPQALYQQKIEYVEDRLGIERYGYNPSEIIAFGCTSRGQAVRAGNWLLYTERVESNIVSFSAGLDSVYCTPGTIIKVFDEALVGVEYSGRIVSSLTNTISLDREVTLATGQTYSVRLSTHNPNYSPTDEITASDQIGTNPSYYTQTFTITNIPGSYETLTLSGVPTNLLVGATWSIYSTSLNEKLYRVVSLKESDSIGVYEISAMLHNPDKFAFIENNIQLEERTYSTLSALPEAVSLESIVSSSGTYRDSSDILRTSLTVGFSAALYASSYTLEIKRNSGNWVEVYTKKAELNYTFYDLSANEEYAIKITPFNIIGKSGPSTIAHGFTIEHTTEAVGNSMVANFRSTLRPTDLLLEWDAYPSIELVTYTISKGASYETSSVVYSGITSRSQAITENTVGTYTYWIIAVFNSGDYTNPTILDIHITAPLPVVDVRSSGELNQNSLGWEFQETKVGTLETEIWSASTNNRTSATKLISLAYPTSTYTHTELGSEQTVYYWLRVKDTRGNTSIYYPFSEDKGLKVTTRIGTPEVLGLIAGSITSSELHADLNETLDSVDEAVFGIDGVTDGLIGTYSVKIDSGGKVAGYGLYNDATTSRFIVSANEFAVTTPDSSLDLIARNTTYAVGKCVRVSDLAYKHLMLVCKGAGTSHSSTNISLAGKVLGNLVFDNNVTWQVASRVPISVFALGTSVDQTTVYPGVYIDGATILNATINSAQIVDAAITNAKIGNYITSSNFDGNIVNDVITTQGTAGWGIDKAGNAYFTNATISGQITVGMGSIVPYSYVQSGPPADATRNVYRGVWSSGISYVVGDSVIHQGYGWSCIVATNSIEPPVYPVTSNANWVLAAVKGEDGIDYDVIIESSNGIIFRVGGGQQTTLKARVFRNGVEVTDEITPSKFKWTRTSIIPQGAPYDDASWNALYGAGYKQILVSVDDVHSRATFHCEISS